MRTGVTDPVMSLALKFMERRKRKRGKIKGNCKLSLFVATGNENLIFDEGAVVDPRQIGSYRGQILIFLQQRKVCCNLGIQLEMKEFMVFVYNLIVLYCQLP